MRKTSLTVLMLMALYVPNIAKAACDVSGVAYTTAQTGYIYQDFGLVASHKPALQSGATVSCGGFSLDLWTSVELSSQGRFGRRGGGDEGDLTLSYSNKISTPIGPLAYELGSAYYALGYGGGLATSNDDVAHFYADVGRPIEVGKATLTPFVRQSLYRTMSGNLRNEWVMRTGVRFSVPLNNWLSLSGDLSAAFNTTRHNRTVFRPTVLLSADAGDG